MTPAVCTTTVPCALSYAVNHGLNYVRVYRDTGAAARSYLTAP